MAFTKRRRGRRAAILKKEHWEVCSEQTTNGRKCETKEESRTRTHRVCKVTPIGPQCHKIVELAYLASTAAAVRQRQSIGVSPFQSSGTATIFG